MPNALAGAASPYLRSHAENPVDWRPWGPAPFAEAARRDIPVLVSIGYSTCHWCHVMARESFSDPEVAAIMNTGFVAIKVDREEHAEVDSTYLAAASAFTGDLGWPLTVFVTPEGRAFFAGTYWPPIPAHGRPSFREVLAAVTDAWTSRRDEVERNGAAIAGALSRPASASAAPPVSFDAVVAELAGYEDVEHGGFGGAPKFPVAPVLRFLLDRGTAGDVAAAALAGRTLDAMASSDLRDRVDGGFFRYATRADWTEPHYERMLYDNAQLLAVSAIAGRAEVAEGIAAFLIGTLQRADGGFASAQDSESVVDGQRVEGFYYTLDAPSRARVAAPALDEKVLTGWNGLAIEALALAGSLLDRPEWIDSAARAADLLLERHVTASGLVRASIGQTLSSARPTLDDYGMLAGGLLELAIASGEVLYAVQARRLVDAVLAAGASPAGASAAGASPAGPSPFGGSPFGVPDGADPVLVSQGLAVEPDPSDGAHPSGISAMAAAAHRLYLLSGHEPYRAAAESAMAAVSAAAAGRPISHGAALSVLSALAEPVRQLVVVSDVPSPSVEMARHRVGGLSIALSTDAAEEFAANGFELLTGRTTRPGIATAYLCEDFTCRLPITDPAALAAALG